MPGNPYEKDILTTNRKNTFFKTLPLQKNTSGKLQNQEELNIWLKLVSRSWWFAIDLIRCKIRSLAEKFFGRSLNTDPEVILNSCAKVFAWQSALHLFLGFLGQFCLGFFWVEEIWTLDVLRFVGGLIWRILTGLHRFQRFLWFAKQNNWEWLDTPSDFGTSITGEQKHNQADWF